MDQLLAEYSTLYDYVYRYVRVRVSNEDVCRDLVADIFLKAVEKIQYFDASKGSLRQWITGITKHHLLNHWKREKHTFALEDFDLPIMPKFDQLEFDQLIDHLPQHIQQLLTWRYVDDLTYEQIADVTGRTPAALRKYFSRLYKKLRNEYEAY